MKTNLKQMSEEGISLFIDKIGQKPYRAGQIIDWIYKKLASDFDEMTNLSKDLRNKLKKTAYISNLNLLQKLVSKDSSRKFLFKLEDGETIESVLMPNNTGEDCFTLCISSQAGCAMGCRFCRTGSLGLRRNLRAYEIVDQVIAVRRIMLQHAPARITNIVFMGMGEPLNNFNEVASALNKLKDLMGFSKRKITVSTVGIIPGIKKLARSGLDVNLAVSLNATTDKTRNLIMPVNKKYPIKELMDACRAYPLSPRRRITFEYVLLDGFNDSRDDALRLIKLLRGIKSKVNLIPYNPGDSSGEFKCPPESRLLEFQTILNRAGITAKIRKSMGADIAAACGQLKASYM